MQLDYHHRPARSTPRDCAMRCTRSSTAIPTWRPDSANNSTSRCRSSRPIPRWRGGTSISRRRHGSGGRRSSGCVLPSASRSATSPVPPAFRVALIRTAPDRHRVVLTNHHIVLDGWSLPILLQEIFAGYLRAPTARRPAPYRTLHHLAGRSRHRCRPRGLARRAGRVRHPHPGRARRPARAWDREAVKPPSAARGDHRGHRRAGALAPHHRQHRAASRLGTGADVADRPARRRLRHRGLGTARRGGRRGIDGRTVDQHRAGAGAHHPDHHRHRPARPTAKRPHHTLEHQHLALSDIHRITGHDQLFDTLFVYENYPSTPPP